SGNLLLLLNDWASSPAMVLNRILHVLAANRLARLLFSAVSLGDSLVRLVFLTPASPQYVLIDEAMRTTPVEISPVTALERERIGTPGSVTPTPTASDTQRSPSTASASASTSLPRHRPGIPALHRPGRRLRHGRLPAVTTGTATTYGDITAMATNRLI